jgi:peptidoglycan/LPS O-acetylase OafA/YrhL
LLLLMLLIDASMSFRVRPVLAGVVAWALWAFGESENLPVKLRAAWRSLSDASYAIFVVHFAVILGFSAAWSRHASDSTLWAWSFFGLAWLVSVVLGMALHRWVKTPKNWTGIARG